MQTQVKHEATKKPHNDSASVDNDSLVSRSGDIPIARQIAETPVSYQPRMINELKTIDEKDYFRDIDSTQAEAKCCNTGYYLVRHSAEQNKYLLTVNWKGKGIHFPIQEFSDVSLVNMLLFPQKHLSIFLIMHVCFIVLLMQVGVSCMIYGRRDVHG